MVGQFKGAPNATALTTTIPSMPPTAINSNHFIEASGLSSCLIRKLNARTVPFQGFFVQMSFLFNTNNLATRNGLQTLPAYPPSNPGLRILSWILDSCPFPRAGEPSPRQETAFVFQVRGDYIQGKG